MRYRLIIGLLATLHSSAFAEQSFIADKALDAPVLDLTQHNGAVLAVGDRGHVLRAEGDSWRQMQVPSRVMLTAVTGHNGGVWAVGHDATILTSHDNGASWSQTLSLPERDKPLLDVIALNDKHLLAVGAYGLMFRSEDGGQSWQEEFHDELLFPEDRDYLLELKAEDEALYLDERSAILPHFNRITQLADGRLYMVGEMGFVAVSEDQGRHWQALEPFYFGSLYDLIELSDGSLLAMGLRGHLFLSEDGNQWQELDSPVESTINAGTQLQDGTVVLTANGGYLLVSKDNGRSFEAEILAKGVDLVTLSEGQGGGLTLATSEGIQRIALP
ncbi:WD40/YVTN/BNR-like repeat-containing protein [Ferrimonas marina]|uniref:Photosynthesis system II assembly factor Ycf48/Hcf136-like domain-containing protein n=1 Tax=Ferrimonas marina TaxID=299255 RepID=A0A1M5NHG6_9GAMM|nr:YCF48-related protein [Ferrimonas marina]SHG88649.1 Uncharacterized protein SAMN02745129_1046 [Ferrimonas marina]